MAKNNIGSSITSSISNAILGRFVEIPKGKKVVVKIWRNVSSDVDITSITPPFFRNEKIVGYLASDFSFDVGSQFTQPFDKASSAILNTVISAVTGGDVSLVNKFNQSMVFEKSEPLAITLDLEFRTRYDAYLDVWRPISTLALESLPAERAGGVLSSSYPNFFHFSDKIFDQITKLVSQVGDQLGVPALLTKSATKLKSKVSSLIAGVKNTGYTYIQIIIGDFFVVGPVLIDKVTPTFSNELSTSRTETLAKLIELAVKYTGGGARGIGTLKLVEYALNVPVFGVDVSAREFLKDFSPSRRYPNSGKASISFKTLWGYTQEDAKISMKIKTSNDKSFGRLVSRGKSVAEKTEELLDLALFTIKEKGAFKETAATELARATLGDLVPGGTI